MLGGQKSIKRALRAVKNPRKTLFRMRELINFLVQQLEQLVKENGKEPSYLPLLLVLPSPL